MNLAFDFLGSEYHGTVAPLRKMTIYLPAGMGGSQAGFPVCEVQVLELYGPEGCPQGSAAGPPGSITLTAQIAGEMVVEHGLLNAYFAPSEGLLLYMNAPSPIAAQVYVEANSVEGLFPYDRGIVFEWPLIEAVPGAPAVSITSFNLELGASRQAGSTTVSSVISPGSCPESGEFPWASSVTLEGGRPETILAETVCPGFVPSNGGATPTGTVVQPAPTGSETPITPNPTPVVHLTRAQKLAKALHRCKKTGSPHRRKICEARARKRYGPKPKSHRR